MKKLLILSMVLMCSSTLEADGAMIGGGGKHRATKASRNSPDIVGVRLGMSYDEAKAALDRFAAKEGGQVRVSPIQPPTSLGYSGNNDSIGVGLSKAGEVFTISRHKRGSIDENELLQALEKKYGNPAINDVRPNMRHASNMYWAYDPNGRLVAIPENCKSAAMSIGGGGRANETCSEIDTIIRVSLEPSKTMTAGIIDSFQIGLASRTTDARARQAQKDFAAGIKNQNDQKAKDAAKQNKTSL